MKKYFYQFIKWIKFNYAFTQGEAIAVTILLILSISILLVNIYVQNSTPAHSKNTLIVNIDTVENDKNASYNYYNNKAITTNSNKEDLEINGIYDPNTLNINDWQQILPLSERQAKSIIKYKNYIKGFKNITDISNCYVLNKYALQLSKHLIFNEPKIKNIEENIATTFLQKNVNNYTPKVVELNQADTNSLIKLPFIGSKIAQRIVKYGERLGGYYNKEQLYEVYGVDSARYNQIEMYLKVDGFFLTKININEVTYTELISHPYFPKELARNIIMYRNMHGKYTNISELKNCELMSDVVLLKIAPYISIN